MGQSGTPSQVKSPAAVWMEAKSRVIAQGGDHENHQLVASQCAIGRYQGKTFRWLLSNDLGYATMVLAGHQRERESGSLSDTALMGKTDVFLRYASSFPKISEAIRQRRQLAAHSDECLVGFGAHKHCTHKELYDSMDWERRR